MHSDFYLPNSVVRVHYQAMDGISVYFCFGCEYVWSSIACCELFFSFRETCASATRSAGLRVLASVVTGPVRLEDGDSPPLLHGASRYYCVLWFTLMLIYWICFVKKARRWLCSVRRLHFRPICIVLEYIIKKQTKKITDWILKWFRAALALSPSFFSDQKNVFM